MKPHRGHLKKRASEAAVRTYLRAHLGWLRGFPDSEPAGETLGWVVLPRLTSRAPVRRLTVDREVIRKTSYARNAVMRRFPKALRRVVGDVDHWAAQVAKRLELLKATIHEGESLPDAAALLEAAGARRSTRANARAVAKRLDALYPMMLARAWLHWGEDAELDAALARIEAHARALRVILPNAGLARALRCCDLADAGEAAPLELLGESRAWQVPLQDDGFGGRLQKALRTFRESGERRAELVTRGFARPTPRLALDLMEALDALPHRDPSRRVLSLRLLELLVPREALDAWEAFWQRADTFERSARQLLATPRKAKHDRERLRALAARIKQELEPPPAINLGSLRVGNDRLVAEAPERALERLLEVLAAVPAEGYADRHRLLNTWDRQLRTHGQPRVVERVLAAQRDLLRAHPDLDEQRRAWVCGWLSGELIDVWIHDEHSPRLIEPTLVALGHAIAQSGKWNRRYGPFAHPWGVDALVQAMQLTDDPARAASLVLAAPRDLFGWSTAWEVAFRLNGENPARLSALAERWRALSWTEEQIEELKQRAKRRPHVGSFLLGLILDGHGKRVQRLLSSWSLLRASGQGGDAACSSPPPVLDVDRYPPELHPALRRLGRYEPRAVEVAGRLLARELPTPERLQREVESLERLLPDARGKRADSMRTRLERLRERINNPPPLSPQRLERCRERLDRRARLARLEGEEGQAQRRVAEVVERRLEREVPTDWLESADTVALLRSLGNLKAGFRALAFRLLRVRLGPAPWDLRDDPANAAFLVRLAERGVDPAPWLGGLGPARIDLDGDALTLDLEADPLQVFRMGQPFNTCLSPGAFNFFSTVSNAADVNKRVLFARNASGQILGRCLVVITRAGYLLVFRVYAQDHREAIEAAVREYVERLARAMGTAIVPRGRVETLVASDWYDDGPVDLTGRMEFLGRFNDRLKTIAPSELLTALEEAVAPDPVTPSILNLLLQQAEFRARPELVTPLLAMLEAEGDALDATTRLTAVGMARRAGDRAGALRLIAPISRGRVPGDCCADCTAPRVSDELVALGVPHRGLRLIRRTRPSHLRGWEGESSSRLKAAARALEALHRPRKALRLYRLARYDTASAIRRLEAQLAEAGD